MAQSEDRRDKGFYLPSEEEIAGEDFNFADGVDPVDVLKFADYAIGYLAERVAQAMTEWNAQYQEAGKNRYLVRKVSSGGDIVPSPGDGEGDWQLGVEDNTGGDIV